MQAYRSVENSPREGLGRGWERASIGKEGGSVSPLRHGATRVDAQGGMSAVMMMGSRMSETRGRCGDREAGDPKAPHERELITSGPAHQRTLLLLFSTAKILTRPSAMSQVISSITGPAEASRKVSAGSSSYQEEKVDLSEYQDYQAGRHPAVQRDREPEPHPRPTALFQRRSWVTHEVSHLPTSMAWNTFPYDPSPCGMFAIPPRWGATPTTSAPTLFAIATCLTLRVPYHGAKIRLTCVSLDDSSLGKT
jgi:hypothetical protein